MLRFCKRSAGTALTTDADGDTGDVTKEFEYVCEDNEEETISLDFSNRFDRACHPYLYLLWPREMQRTLICPLPLHIIVVFPVFQLSFF